MGEASKAETKKERREQKKERKRSKKRKLEKEEETKNELVNPTPVEEDNSGETSNSEEPTNPEETKETKKERREQKKERKRSKKRKLEKEEETKNELVNPTPVEENNSGETSNGEELTDLEETKKERQEQKKERREQKKSKKRKLEEEKETKNELVNPTLVEEDNSGEGNNSEEPTNPKDTEETQAELIALDEAYQTALQAFKADKTNKDLRRAKSAAKKAWDTALIASAAPGVQPLTCRNCSQIFLFEDHALFTERGWMQPVKCKKCTYEVDIVRSQDRCKRDERQNMCYDFQKTGACSRGDRCRFSHATEHTGKNLLAKIQAVPMCKYFKRGETCPHGECRFKHFKE